MSDTLELVTMLNRVLRYFSPVTNFSPVIIATTLVVLIDVRAANADEAVDAALLKSRQYGSAALAHLRNDRLTETLVVLGQATDLATPWQLIQDDGLGPASAGLYRSFAQLDADEQYDLLHTWTMPTDSRQTIRLLTTLIPQEGPPKAFARALGERPRDESFAISDINGIRGLFSSGWMLVKSAEETGRLRRLVSELEPLAAKNIPNADVLILLAQLVNHRGDFSQLRTTLESRVAALRESVSKPGRKPGPIDSANILLAAAALPHWPHWPHWPLRASCEPVANECSIRLSGEHTTEVPTESDRF
jgi:hypothetical protein